MTDQIPNELVTPAEPLEPEKVAKVRKPRSPRKTGNERAALVLSAPTNLNGTKNQTLHTTVGKKFERVVLLSVDGKTVKAVVRAGEGEKQTQLGSATFNFLFALLDACLAGQGQGPDGSALWVVEKWDKIKSHWSAEFPKLILKAEPGGRSGAQGYAAPLSVWMDIARAKSIMISASLKKFGVAKSVQRAVTSRDEPAPHIQL